MIGRGVSLRSGLESFLAQPLRRLQRHRELSLNSGGLSRSGASACGSTDLDPLAECQTENEFWLVIVAIETAPSFLRDRSICLRS